MSMAAQLNGQTSPLLMASVAERKAWIEQDHWVHTDTSQIAFRWMESLLLSHRRLRPRCMQIVAAAGMGKTALLKAFAEQHPVVTTEDPLRLQRPVLLVNATIEGRGVGELRQVILKGLWPDATQIGYQQSALDLDASLRAQGVRVLALDEAGELLKCGPALHGRILGELRRITHELHINIVAASVEGMSHAFKQDEQLQSRFKKIIKIPTWTESQEFRDFVFGLEQFLPFPNRSLLDRRQLVQWLLRYCRNTEDVVGYIQDAALHALGQGASHVALEHFELARTEVDPPPITLQVSA